MKTLEQIACDYHYYTEHYDRLVCTGGISEHGTAMPRTAEENHKIQVNARQERISAEMKGKELGFSTKEVGKAISDYAGIFNYEKEHSYRIRFNPEIQKQVL